MGCIVLVNPVCAVREIKTMNVRMLRAFFYWCSAACLLLFAGDLSTQHVSLNRNVPADTSLSSRFAYLAQSVGQSSVFVAHAIHSGVGGASEAALELLPYLVDTSIDIANIVCNSIAHPITAFEKAREKVTSLALQVTDFFVSLDWETLQRYQRIMQNYYIHYCELPAAERGECFGSLVGYHVMDFYGGSIAIKTAYHMKNYSYVKQVIQRKGIASFAHIKPAERVKGFAIAVNQATRRERYMYELKHSLSEPHTRSYAPSDYDAMRLLLECSPLRAVGTTYTSGYFMQMQTVTAS